MNCVVCGTVEPSSLPWARMCVGWVMNDRDSVTIGPGIVAEKSIVCRLSGTIARIRSMSGRKPRSSISSASSRTSTLTLPRIRWPCWARASEPARGADDDLDAVVQRLDLRLEGAAAVDRLHPDAAL